MFKNESAISIIKKEIMIVKTPLTRGSIINDLPKNPIRPPKSPYEHTLPREKRLVKERLFSGVFPSARESDKKKTPVVAIQVDNEATIPKRSATIILIS